MMVRRSIATGSYLVACSLMVLLATNALSLFVLSLAEASAGFFSNAITVFVAFCGICFVLLPLALCSYPQIAARVISQDELNFVSLLKDLPRAYVRCLLGVFHSAATIVVFLFPIFCAAVACTILVLRGQHEGIPFWALSLISIIMLGIIARQLAARMLMPFLSVLTGFAATPLRDLCFSILPDFSRHMITTLICGLSSIALGFAVLPISGAEFATLLGGGILNGTSAIDASLFLRAFILLALVNVWLLCFNFVLGAALHGRQQKKLQSLLESNVTEQHIETLARAGYFTV